MRNSFSRNLRRVLRKFSPGLAPLVRMRNESELRKLARSGPAGVQLAEVYKSFFQQSWSKELSLFDRIEAQREQARGLSQPLVDGTLGEAPAWDASITIADAEKASRPSRACELIYHLVRCFRPSRVLELGTNLGVSGAYIATALQANGEQGTLVTMDGSPYRQRFARNLFERLDLENVELVLGHFDETFDRTAASKGPFELAFIDGNHKREPTLHYVNALCEYAAMDCLIVLDDIRWSEGMQQAWQHVRQDRRVAAALDLHSMAICIMSPTGTVPGHVTRPLYLTFR